MKKLLYYLTLPAIWCLGFAAQIRKVFAGIDTQITMYGPAPIQALYGVEAPYARISFWTIILAIVIPIIAIILIILGIIKLVRNKNQSPIQKPKDKDNTSVKQDNPDR